MPLVLNQSCVVSKIIVNGFAAFVADKEDFALNYIPGGYEINSGRRWVTVKIHPYVKGYVELICSDLDDRWGGDIRLAYRPDDELNAAVASIYSWFTTVEGELFTRRSFGTADNRTIYRWGDMISYSSTPYSHNTSEKDL